MRPALANIDTVFVPLQALLSHPVAGPVLLFATMAALPYYLAPAYFAVVALVAAHPLLFAYLRARKNAVPLRWQDEIVLVTGGSHGVGLRLVEKLLAQKQRPKRIVVLDINDKHKFGDDSVAVFQCDVSKHDVVKQVAAKVIAEVGHPTIIINNAGIVMARLFDDLTEEQMTKTIGVNLLGPMYLCKAFLPGLKRLNRGHIVNMSSILGVNSTVKMTDYSASKSGLIGFNDALREELRDHTNIRVSMLNPGLIETGMFDGLHYRYPFLTPFLSSDDVADAVLRVLEGNISTTVVMPFLYVLGPIMKTLPVEYQELVSDIVGANDVMRKMGSH